VRLEVHDNGGGVPPSLEASLFKPFTSTKPQGTGLGLVSVKECALAHGGRVEFGRSDLGGAVFSVVFPVAITSPEAAESPLPA
jgi:nitrogen-specific signal transduction histidine kinase